jgi:TonB-linked SusC/RagA family outer membrane protein
MKLIPNGRVRSSGFCEFIRAMKITILLFFLGTAVAFSSTGYSQDVRVTLSIKDATVKEVFKAIEGQTEFIFFYQDQELDQRRTVTINSKDKPVTEVLDALFRGTDNVYVIRERQITIGRSPNKTISAVVPAEKKSPEPPRSFEVSGRVTDATTGEPLPAVNVLVEGTTTGTSTNADGHYVIPAPSGTSVLLFSFVGYVAQKVAINNRPTINIRMKTDVLQIEEVVTIGYGIQKKVNLSGAVDVVSSKDLDSRPVNNVVQALQGLAPNLNVIVGNEGGELGGKNLLNIRGIGSISGAGGSPYILVDGIEQDIYNINPDDVESISVLKDAAASAIYGARAAFGVILVTTKKGKKDGVTLNYSTNYSFASPIHLPKMVNSIQFAEYMNLAAANDGVANVFQPIIIEQMKKYQAGEIKDWTMPVPWAPNFWLTYAGGWANTDWFDVDYKKWVPKSVHNISLSGGNENTQYYISGSTFNQEGLLTFGNDNYFRNNLNARVNTKVFNWLRVNFLSKFNRTNLDRPSHNKDRFYADMARRWSTNGVYFPDGNLNYEGEQLWLERGGRYLENTNELSIIPGLEIEPVKGWIIYANYRWKMNANGSSNHEAKVTGTFVNGTPFYLRANNYFATSQYQSYYNSPNVYSSYNKTIGNHEFTAMAGFEQEVINYNSAYSRKNDLISDLKPSLGTATGKEFASGTLGHWATRSFFGRLNYSFMGKYLVELSARNDGSSRFEEGFRWGTFPSGSVAYLVSKEPFWTKIQPYVGMLKIRGSYGSLGNQDVANYLYIERLPIYTSLPYIIGSDRPNYVGMAGLISPGLTWEKVRTSNIGFDAGFLKNRLTLSFDYFLRNTFDMLGPAESYPSILGTPVPQSNNADLRTKGFELVMGWRDNKSEFQYDARFMLSDATTTIVKYRNPQNLLSAPYYEGKTLGEIWGYTSLGLFQTDQEAAGWNQSYITPEVWKAGDVKYADLNGDGKIDIGKNTLDDHGDLSVIGNLLPRYSYSFLFDALWKGLSMNMIWQGVGKRDLWLNSPHFWGVGWIYTSVGFEEHMNFWTKDNPDAYYPLPRMDKSSRNKQVQTRYLQNGAYLRLKSLQFGYTLPRSFTKKFFIDNLRIYVVGENLLTITKLITIFDPEATGGVYGAGAIYPIQRSLSVGLNVTL